MAAPTLEGGIVQGGLSTRHADVQTVRLPAQTRRAPTYAFFGGGVSSMLATVLRRIAADW